MKTIKFISIIIISLLFSACPHGDEEADFYIKISNTSDENVYFHYRGTKNSEEYPDNYLYEWEPNENYLIMIDDSVSVEGYNTGTSTTYRIFIYKASTLEANDWETVRDNGLYDARFDLTLDELKAMNYEIVYDGM